MGPLHRRKWSLLFPPLALLAELAEKGMAIQPLGITKIEGQMYLVQPLHYGPNPFANWGFKRTNVSEKHLKSFLDFKGVVEKVFPAWGEITLSLEPNWTNQLVTNNEERRDIIFQRIGEFLVHDSFFSTIDGNILLESFDISFSLGGDRLLYQLGPPEILHPNRWTWMTYALLFNSSQNVVDNFIKELRQRKMVRELVSLRLLGETFTHHPDLNLHELFEFTGPVFELISDIEKPYQRPTQLKFSDQSRLKYHFKKHGWQFQSVSA